MIKLSIILPTFNEIKVGWLKGILESFKDLSQTEVIIVDNNSNDATREMISFYPYQFYQENLPLRSQRLNYGIKKAQGDIILLHHPRSILAPEAFEVLREAPLQAWGGFTHKFDRFHPILYWTSWYSNEIRAKRKGIVYLDHCLFFRRELLQNDPEPVPELDIFEDTELSHKLKRFGRPQILPQKSTTSSIRYEKNGPWKQALLNQKMKLQYYMGKQPEKMNKDYEEGLCLNTTYGKKEKGPLTF